MKNKPFPWDKRKYKPGFEPHDEAAYQGGNVPDASDEPESTLGVQLMLALTELSQAIMFSKLDNSYAQAHLRQHLFAAHTAVEKAIEHYDDLEAK